jgi:hypothetical protein
MGYTPFVNRRWTATTRFLLVRQPATPAYQTQWIFSKPLIFIAIALAIASFCSRSLRLIHCDFVAAFSPILRDQL